MTTTAAPRPYPTAASARGGRRPLKLHEQWLEDLDAVVARDPSCPGRAQALLHLPWWALAVHRVAHRRHTGGKPLSALLLSTLARIITGVEVRPGATIGRRLFIDHGAAVVIGDTAVVGDDVTIYQHVTLGSRGWWDPTSRQSRRHPRIGDRVRIGVGTSVLGPVTVASDTVLRAHSLVLTDFPALAGSPGDD